MLGKRAGLMLSLGVENKVIIGMLHKMTLPFITLHNLHYPI